MPMPDLSTLLNSYRTRARSGSRTAASGVRGRRRRRPVAVEAGSAMRLRRRTRGSALVLALMAGLVALIGALLLASRLFSSRFSSASRSDTLAAREAAEYGLNTIQAKLNTNELGYLWVTKKEQWGNVTREALGNCQVSVLDADGEEIANLPALPDELAASEAQEIKSAGDTRITYELTGFQPPNLPVGPELKDEDRESLLAQEAFCGETGSGSDFGNLNGGSAIITVTGTVTRGDNKTTFKLSRRTHVAAASAGTELVASFVILGNAYKADKKNKFGDDSDITQLLSADGNICYGTVDSPGCFSPDLPKTVIGCFDLGSCLINNVDLDDKTRSKYCKDVQPKEKGKKKTKAGFTCNEFQQIGDLPPVPLPSTSGMVISGSLYQDSDWEDYSREYDCKADEVGSGSSKVIQWNCEIDGGISSGKGKGKGKGKDKDTSADLEDVRFPYLNTAKLPSSLAATWSLSNSDLVPGCYFAGVDASNSASKADQIKTTAINCLVDKIKIDNDSKFGNFIVHTANGGNQLLPVNIFLHGDDKDKVELSKGGIQGNDVSQYGWNRLRILGEPQETADGDPVACDVSSPIVSKGSKTNDLDNLFLWLPNASLEYDKKGTKENSFAVIWVCQFTGPKKDKDGTKFSIVTPFPEEVARAGVAGIDPTLGSSFVTVGGGTYRGFGSQDSPGS